MKVEIIGPNLPDQSEGDYHVHKEGCADITARKYGGALIQRSNEARWITEVESQDEIIEEIYSDFLPGGCAADESPEPYTVDDFRGVVKIFPCVGLPVMKLEFPEAPDVTPLAEIMHTLEMVERSSEAIKFHEEALANAKADHDTAFAQLQKLVIQQAEKEAVS